jgi:hypothetical protein
LRERKTPANPPLSIRRLGVEKVMGQQGTGHANRVHPDVGHVRVFEYNHQVGGEASLLMTRLEDSFQQHHNE